MFPVGLRLSGRAVLVVGAGRIAARKAAALAEQGALLTVVAPQHSEAMDAVDVARRLHREFLPRDLDGKWFVTTATGRPEVDGAVFRAASQRRVWCNAADDPEHCSTVLPATARRGDLTISVSSGARSPATASWMRRRVEAMLDDGTLEVFEAAARVRGRLRSAGLPTEVSGWAEVLDEHALELVASGHTGALEDLLERRVGVASR